MNVEYTHTIVCKFKCERRQSVSKEDFLIWQEYLMTFTIH